VSGELLLQLWGRRGQSVGMKRILIVDDSKTALMMSQMILSRYPIEVISAKSGKEAVAKVASERPDLILMDVVMPDMSGLDAIAAIREQEEHRRIPIVVVSTQSDPETVELSYRLGCSDYIVKPVSSTELLAKIRSLLGEIEDG
jgi:CheY-like chemotaxis protein